MMTKAYDGSWQDVANRLRDDEIISLKLVHHAADMIERFGIAIENAINVLNECPHYEGGAGGMSIEAQIARTRINRVPATLTENLFSALYNIDR